MSEQKLTPWFDGSVKPARKGVYEREHAWGVAWFSYWNGKKWMWHATTSAEAFANREYDTGLSNQTGPWRGLASKPKGGAA